MTDVATARPASARGSGLSNLFIVFMASFCTLVLELVAGRLMAPYIGVSIFTWTSIIAVILLGISVGNYLGGIVADRFEPQRTLGLLLVAGGALSILVLVLITFGRGSGDFIAGPIADLLRGVNPGLSDAVRVVGRIIVMTAVLFLGPALVLGMISPVVIKMAVQDLEHTGSVAGRIYAFSTAGAIAGTVFTGFIFVSTIGTRVTVLAVGLTLIVMGVIFGSWRSRRVVAAAAVAVLVVPLLVAARAWDGSAGEFSQRSLEEMFARCGTTQVPCLESNYFTIKVYDETKDGHAVKTLVLDHLIHSYTDPVDSTFLYYDYLQNYADLTEYLRLANNLGPPRVLFLGGGGLTLPRYFEAVYPGSHVEVIEVDPGVVEANFTLLGLPRDTSIKIITDDARAGIDKVDYRSSGRKYDVVFGDAFNDVSVPYHLATKEFAQDVKALVTDEGYYAALVIDNMSSGRFLVSYARTLQDVFPFVTVMATKGGWERGLGTYLVVAGNKPLDREAAERVVRPAARSSNTGFMPPDVFEQWVKRNDPIVLTDDYVPVDQLLAPQVIVRN